jgi:hypothetical protein
MNSNILTLLNQCLPDGLLSASAPEKDRFRDSHLTAKSNKKGSPGSPRKSVRVFGHYQLGGFKSTVFYKNCQFD